MSSSLIDSQAKSSDIARCKCGIEAPIWTSANPETRGLKFYGFPFYKDKDKYCGFFWWCYSRYSGRTTTVIPEMEIEKAMEVKIQILEAKMEAIQLKK